MIHKLRWCTGTWFRERTARACIAHFLDLWVNFRPEISKAHTMKGGTGIEMFANWARMKCKKDKIKQCFGDYLQPGVWNATRNGFPIYKHIIFDHNVHFGKEGNGNNSAHPSRCLYKFCQGCEWGCGGHDTQDHRKIPGLNNSGMVALPQLHHWQRLEW